MIVAFHSTFACVFSWVGGIHMATYKYVASKPSLVGS